MRLDTLQKIANSFLLVDTNVLVDASKNPGNFQGFFVELQKHRVTAVMDQVTSFEFMRNSKDKNTKDKKQKFLEILMGADPYKLVISDNIFSLASDIVSIAYHEGNKELKLADALIAAQIAKYGGEKRTHKLYLATQNHRDFSPCLFTRIDVHIIELDDNALKTIGIYEFNSNAFEKLR